MPLWLWESADEKQARERREGEQKASVAALQAGKLPLQAQRRLQEQRKLGNNFFISDLTSSEHLLTQEAGYEPIGQVMGSAFYKVAYRGYFQGAYSNTGELTVLTHAQLAARELAVQRLRQEAQMLGAHGVIGVHLKAGTYDWSTNLVEFTAIGTAIRVPGRRTDDKPFTSDFSGQEFWKLHQAGYWPKEIAFGVCSYYVHGDYQTRSVLNNFWGSGWANQEITQFTQGFQTARHLAISRLTQDIQRAKAQGAVGMHIDMEVEDIEYEVNDRTYHDLLVQFIAVGTAIVHDQLSSRPQAAAPLTFYDLKDRTTSALEINNIDE
ncbi:MAG: heavy metal-binding domain-containing protein [Gloeobacterales cyanobacterium]